MSLQMFEFGVNNSRVVCTNSQSSLVINSLNKQDEMNTINHNTNKTTIISSNNDTMFVNNKIVSNNNNNNSGGLLQFSSKTEDYTCIVDNSVQPMPNDNFVSPGINFNKRFKRDSEAEEEFQEASNEASVGSVGTTVQETADTGAEVDAEVVDESLAYLQGLNSGNLMQFSQVL